MTLLQANQLKVSSSSSLTRQWHSKVSRIPLTILTNLESSSSSISASLFTWTLIPQHSKTLVLSTYPMLVKARTATCMLSSTVATSHSMTLRRTTGTTNSPPLTTSSCSTQTVRAGDSTKHSTTH